MLFEAQAGDGTTAKPTYGPNGLLRGYVVPIARIREGRPVALLDKAPGLTMVTAQAAWDRFVQQYGRKGRRYLLYWHGVRTGTAIVRPDSADHDVPIVWLKDLHRAPLSSNWLASDLILPAPRWETGTHPLSPVQRRELRRLVVLVFRQKRVLSHLSDVVIHGVAMRLTQSGGIDIVATAGPGIGDSQDPCLFLIAKPWHHGRYRLVLTSFRQASPTGMETSSASVEDLVGAVDLGHSNALTVITQQTFDDEYDYRIDQKRNGHWQAVYESGGADGGAD